MLSDSGRKFSLLPLLLDELQDLWSGRYLVVLTIIELYRAALTLTSK
jgi:hypothetical protein